MRLNEFIELNKLEQSHIIGGAKWVSSKRTLAILTVLYRIDDFHVEAVYRVRDFILIDLRGVSDEKIIKSYELNSNINPFTLSTYKDFRSANYDHRFTLKNRS